MPVARFSDRSVLDVSGPDALSFLDRLVTFAVDRIAMGGAGYGALLTPQGKIISDFVCFALAPDGGRFALDVPLATAADLLKRLGMYRLRAKVTVADLGADHAVVAGWGNAPLPAGPDVLAAAPDPRLPALGWRAVVSGAVAPADDRDALADYHAHRIGLGVPEGGRDFLFGDAFPHEADMDGLAGVAFDKGCYVGQEVVSRTQHRGTARTRIVPALFDGDAPEPGTAVAAGERSIGRTGGASGSRALVSVRLDRVADALAAGETLHAGGRSMRLLRPGWARFDVPGAADEPAVS